MSEEIGIKVTLIPDYSKLEAQLQKKKVRLIVDTSNVSAQLSKELKAYKPKVTISSIQVANKDKALESLSKQLSRVKIVIDGSNVKVKKASIQKAIQNAISGTTNFQFQQTVKSQSKPQSTLNLKTGYNALRSAEAALSRIPQSDGNFVGSVSDSAAHLQRLTSELRTFFNLADGQSISDILSIDPTTITNYDQVLAKITQVRDATIQLQRDSSAKGAAQTYENSIKTEIKRYETLITEMQNYLSDNPRVTSSGYGTSVQQYISEARLAIQALETKNAPQTAAKDLATNFQSLKNNAHDAGLEVENAYVSITRLFKSHMGTAIATAGVLALKQAMQQVIQTVIELDGAITNLRMVTGSSKSETADLVKGYTGMGEELGATTLDIATSANEWLRQGYTLEETNQLIRASMILSKVGMIESGEATKYLTSALKGYKLSAEDAISVVDKLSTVDMEAATSAGGLALAMSRTAASADLSGVSMDKLLGYIAVVAETTQKAEESVGESFKGLFARMGNIKAGRLTDPETEEDLSDVEATLGGLGIKLRDSDSEFRNFGDVLDEVAGKWNEYSSVQKRALSVAFAGTRRQEDFIVLMENYGNAIKYAESSMNSAGTSEQKYDAYLESTEAHLNKFNVAFESLSQNVLQSDTVNAFIDMGAGFLTFCDALAKGNALIPTTIGLITGLAAANGKIPALLEVTSFGKDGVSFLGGKSFYEDAANYLAAVKEGYDAQRKMSAEFSEQGKASLESYLLALKDENGIIDQSAISYGGYIKSLASAKLATIGLKAATALLNGVLSFGATLLIQGVVSAIDDWVHRSERLKEAAIESLNALNSENEAIKSYKEQLTGLNEQLQDNTLSYEEALSIRQQIYDIQSQVYEKYGEEARGIDLVTGSLEKQISALERLQEANDIEWLRENNDAYQDALKQLEGGYDASWIPVEDLETKLGTDAFQKVKEIFEDTNIFSYNSDFQRFDVASGTNALSYLNALQDIYAELSKIEGIEKKDDLGFGYSYLEPISDQIDVIKSFLDEDTLSILKKGAEITLNKEALNLDLGIGDTISKLRDARDALIQAESQLEEAAVSGDYEVLSRTRQDFLDKYRILEGLVKNGITENNLGGENARFLTSMQVYYQDYLSQKDEWERIYQTFFGDQGNVNSEIQSLVESISKQGYFGDDIQAYLEGSSIIEAPEALVQLKSYFDASNLSAEAFVATLEKLNLITGNVDEAVFEISDRVSSAYSGTVDPLKEKQDLYTQLLSGPVDQSVIAEFISKYPEFAQYVDASVDDFSRLESALRSSLYDPANFENLQTSLDDLRETRDNIQAALQNTSDQDTRDQYQEQIDLIDEQVEALEYLYDVLSDPPDNSRFRANQIAGFVDIIKSADSTQQEVSRAWDAIQSLSGFSNSYLEVLKTDTAAAQQYFGLIDAACGVGEQSLLGFLNAQLEAFGVKPNASTVLGAISQIITACNNGTGAALNLCKALAGINLIEARTVTVGYYDHYVAGGIIKEPIQEVKYFIPSWMTNDFKGFGSSYSGGSSKKSGGSGGSGGSSAAKDTTDKHKEAFDNALKELQYKRDKDVISEYEYYQKLQALNDQYFKGRSKYLDDYRKYEIEVYEGLLKAEEERLQKKESNYQKAHNAVIGALDDEIDRLKKEQEEYEKVRQDKIDALQDEIDAIKEKNDETTRELELEKAKEALARAKTQGKLVYHEGTGFVYDYDWEKIQEAQEELDKIEQEIQIDALEKQQDKLQEEIDKNDEAVQQQIDLLEEYKDSWADVLDAYETEQDKLMAQQLIGLNWEKDILAKRLDALEKFKKDYLAIQKELAKYDERDDVDYKNTGSSSPSSGSSGGTSGGGSGSVSGISRTLSNGKSGSDVKALQTALMALGYSLPKYGADGKFGSETANALKKFQKDNGLSADGILGAKTKNAFKIKGYRSGVWNAPGGIANVDEDLPELIARPITGRYTILDPGTSVFNGKMTQNLWNLSKYTPQSLADRVSSNVLRTLPSASVSQNAITIDIKPGAIVLHGVQDTHSLSKAIIEKLPNQLLQDLYRK